MLQINQEILKASKNDHNSWKALQLICLYGKDLFRLFYKLLLFTVLCFKWSVKKNCVAKILLAIRDIFLYEVDRNFSSRQLHVQS